MSDLEGRCFVVREHPGGGKYLSPSDIHADESITNIKAGTEVIMTLRRPRNPEHHKKFFAMLKFVVFHTDNRWADVEELLESLKLAVGHTTKTIKMVPATEEELALRDFVVNHKLYYAVPGKGCVPIGGARQMRIASAMQKAVTKYVTRTKSINFAAMGQDAFEAFFKKSTATIRDAIGWDPEEAMEEERKYEERKVG